MKPNFKNSIAVTIGFLLVTNSVFAEAGTGLKEMLNDPLAWGFATAVVFMLIALAALNRALNTVRALTMRQAQQTAAVEGKKVLVVEEKSILQSLTGTKPIEQEADLLLDHDYDGIQELDNDLPPWWVWGFYITIAYAILYVIFFFGTGAIPRSADEYANEMVVEQEKVDAYLAASGGAVDESNVVLLTDAAALEAGAKIFASNCVACHLADGGGLVGPNLTDEYWIHGGSIVNVFTTIKYGVPAKGMISWQDQLGPVAMQQVASYILSLQGTTPATPKAPEGDKYIPEGQETVPAVEAEAPATETPLETEPAAETTAQ
jgi:cytochrome c oxidase cbb3-type subunit 3